MFDDGKCWAWAADSGDDGDMVLYLRVPGDVLKLFMFHSQMYWNERGPICGWDGDAEQPTLIDSIQAPHGFHGYLRQGKLYDVSGKEIRQ